MSERRALFTTVALFLLPVLVAVGFNIALGYDEAVYAGFARQLVTGDPADGWGIHRPPGLSIIGTVPMLFGLSMEWSLRLIGVVAGVGLILACWWAARRLGGPAAGIVAAVAIAAASPVQVESSSFLTDVPATALLVIIATLMWRSVTIGPAWASVASIGILAAAAFYMRYGSLIAIAALAAAVLVAAPRQVAQRAGAIGLAIVVFALLLVPHLVIATAEAGSPLGIIGSAERAASGTPPSIGSYLAWYPWQLMGPLAAIVGLFGVVRVAKSIIPRNRRAGEPDLGQFVGIAVVLQVVFVGGLIHAEPRYLLFPMAQLVILGAIHAGRVMQPYSRFRSFRRASVAVGAAALMLGGVLTVSEISGRAEAWNWTRAIGRDIGSAAHAGTDGQCSVLTADVPIIAWYSGCSALNLALPLDEQLASLTGSRQFIVVRDDQHLQRSEPAIARLIASRGKLRDRYQDGDGHQVAELYELASPK
jgi:4-amino-4-deoxy-L-arabinose transferase-like glycosyltransferase